uniref:Enolase 4 n=1 Tax=Cyclopterus lumpus TaxID=8103 RepID=A0A8C2WVE7_CYCLU
MSHRGFPSRVPEEQRDLDHIRSAAAEFYRATGVPQVIERALNELFFREPEDVHGYLANYFTNLCAPPRISRLKGREVYDARGQLSIEAEVFCIVCNQEKVKPVRQTQPFLINNQRYDFFTARFLEDKDLRNKEKEESGPPSEPEVLPSSPVSAPTKNKKSVDKGKKSNTAEKSFPPAEPPEPVFPGSSAIGSVSLAVAKTAAKIQGTPLYKYIAAPAQFHIPVPLVTLLSCGKTCPGKLSLLEEVILIPKAGQRVKQIITTTLELQKEMMRIMNASTKAMLCDSGALAVAYERPEQPLDLITEACTNSGLALGTEIHLALNCAAPELMDCSKGKYEVATGVLKSPDELVDMYQTLISKYPAVVALIDPFRREDIDQWEKLSNGIGDSCSLLSDLTFKSKAPPLPGVRGHILKHIHETTVSDLICITSDHQVTTVCCAGSSLVERAVGLGLDYVKLGGLSGAERMAKYNRMISIEEELDQQGILGRFFFLMVQGDREHISLSLCVCVGCERKLCVRNHTNVYLCV